MSIVALTSAGKGKLSPNWKQNKAEEMEEMRNWKWLGNCSRIWDTALSFISPQGLVFLNQAHSEISISESMSSFGLLSRSSLVRATSKCLSKWNDYTSFMRVFNHSPVVLSCPLEHVCPHYLHLSHVNCLLLLLPVPLLWGVPVMHNCPCPAYRSNSNLICKTK